MRNPVFPWAEEARRRTGVLVLAAATAWATAGWTADLGAAKAFVEQTYRAYCNKCDVDFDRAAPRQLSPRLLALVKRDQKLTPAGDVGALDGDPICDCQDFTITAVRAEARAAGPERATATVWFRNFGRPHTMRLDLVATPGGWRIDNIHSAGTPDLADYLQKHAGGR